MVYIKLCFYRNLHKLLTYILKVFHSWLIKISVTKQFFPKKFIPRQFFPRTVLRWEINILRKNCHWEELFGEKVSGDKTANILPVTPK